ncbi:GAF domain-containing protein [Weissella diestrammenae]|uniref:GAF domain-containing protein n=1 Tax=Weissella diestrammenae TaxID=1162633 RepID=A0A7G9T3H3_9LACO|nr:GAF domain-containing protein [Weissella diestrammenae]MCM0582106.1 GAF domain-containing protein [Weissella diestrammenae]QNN74648.1 GAF domain-containing protein [Weissella diestrammenae]
MTETILASEAPLLSQLLDTWVEVKDSSDFSIATYANAAAVLFENLTQVNWAGFYLYHKDIDELILGPFVGKAATVRIKANEGVVGHAFSNQTTVVVDDVHAFDGHIACDLDSNAEIVIPITRKNGERVGVLDIDSVALNRFSAEDQVDLEHFVQTLLKYV